MDWVERLRHLDSCSVSDAVDRLGIGIVLSGFGRWGLRRVTAGRVRTVQLEACLERKSHRHLGTRVLSTSGPDDVIVIANGGDVSAGSWGGLLTLQAHVKGVAGVIVDGALRDADDIEKLDVVVFARATTSRTARGRFREVATDVPISVEGFSVEPDALVIADGSGVVFLAQHQAEKVITVAEEISRAEARMAKALLRGVSGTEVMDLSYEGLTEREPRP